MKQVEVNRYTHLAEQPFFPPNHRAYYHTTISIHCQEYQVWLHHTTTWRSPTLTWNELALQQQHNSHIFVAFNAWLIELMWLCCSQDSSKYLEPGCTVACYVQANLFCHTVLFYCYAQRSNIFNTDSVSPPVVPQSISLHRFIIFLRSTHSTVQSFRLCKQRSTVFPSCLGDL